VQHPERHPRTAATTTMRTIQPLLLTLFPPNESRILSLAQSYNKMRLAQIQLRFDKLLSVPAGTLLRPRPKRAFGDRQTLQIREYCSTRSWREAVPNSARIHQTASLVISDQDRIKRCRARNVSTDHQLLTTCATPMRSGFPLRSLICHCFYFPSPVRVKEHFFQS
jgi:hypothetical protein